MGIADWTSLAKDLSWRKFLVWRAWLKAQWNNPSRSDHYLMQIDNHLCSLAGGKLGVLEDYKLVWTSPSKDSRSVECQSGSAFDVTAPPGPLTTEQIRLYNGIMAESSLNKIVGVPQ